MFGNTSSLEIKINEIAKVNTIIYPIRKLIFITEVNISFRYDRSCKRECQIFQLNTISLQRIRNLLMWPWYAKVVLWLSSFTDNVPICALCCRAAARCGKGVDILFTVCIEPFVMIAARVQRGPAHADACVQQIKMLLHCRMCEEMVFSTAGLAPLG